MDYPVTNSTTNLLKFVHRHDNCTFAEIKAKFPKVDSMELVNLSLTNYLLCTRPGELPTQFQDGNFSVPDNFGRHRTQFSSWRVVVVSGSNGSFQMR